LQFSANYGIIFLVFYKRAIFRFYTLFERAKILRLKGRKDTKPP